MKFPEKTSPKVGDVNITEICKNKKQINHFFESKLKNNTDNNESIILKRLSKKLNIPEDEVIYKVKIPESRKYVVYGHPEFGKIIEEWSNRNKQEWEEEKIRQSLEKELTGKKAPTKAGQIDVLTAEEIIEVKHVKKWKEGIGQLMVFGKIFPNHRKRLHLFGKFPRRINTEFSTELLSSNLIKEFCNMFEIEVTMEAERKPNMDISEKDELEYDLAQLGFSNIFEKEDKKP